jgi:hypothetical protein
VELATHSSELMPGGSPFFPNERSIERLYETLESLFCEAAKNFRGMTLENFESEFSGHSPDEMESPPNPADNEPLSVG